MWYLRASTPEERQTWIDAIELHQVIINLFVACHILTFICVNNSCEIDIVSTCNIIVAIEDEVRTLYLVSLSAIQLIKCDNAYSCILCLQHFIISAYVSWC